MKARKHNEIHQVWKVNVSIAVHDRNAKDKETGEIAGMVDTQQPKPKAAAASIVAVPSTAIKAAVRLIRAFLETSFPTSHSATEN